MTPAADKSTILVTGANGQLGSEIRELSVRYPFYNYIFTTKYDLPVENRNALKIFLKSSQYIFASTVRHIPLLIRPNRKRRKPFL